MNFRYSPGQRNDLIIHTDKSYMTGLLLVNDDFEGGEFFLYPMNSDVLSRRLKSTFAKSLWQEQKRKEGTLPIISNFKAGDLILFFGPQYHGLLPVIAGERYTLLYFFRIPGIQYSSPESESNDNEDNFKHSD